MSRYIELKTVIWEPGRGGVYEKNVVPFLREWSVNPENRRLQTMDLCGSKKLEILKIGGLSFENEALEVGGVAKIGDFSKGFL